MTQQKVMKRHEKAAHESEAKCIKTAERWLARHVGETRTSSRISKALRDYAESVTGNTWNTTKNNLIRWAKTQHPKLAEKIKETSNPIPLCSRKKSRKRCKKGSVEDVQKIYEELKNKEHEQACAALFLALTLGLRPAEMNSIETIKSADGEKLLIRIQAVKVRSDRGMSRDLIIPYNETVCAAAKLLVGVKMGPIQKQIARAAKRVFPRRKQENIPSLYSFRHQLGSNLKSSGMDRRKIAAIMGHRSQSSADVYGSARSGGGRAPDIKPSEATLKKVSSKPPKQIPVQQNNVMNTLKNVVKANRGDVSLTMQSMKNRP